MSFLCCGALPASPDRRSKQPASRSRQRPAEIHVEAEGAEGNNAAQGDADALEQELLYGASVVVPDELQDSEYAGMCRQLLAIVEAMREAGASAVLDLPQVVVAGNQSAGKSSVIEAVCGITLPRSDGTCTRCPIEVVMSDAPGRPWMAAVRIRREFEPSGGRLDHPELTTVKANIADPTEVEGAVRAAQDMLLAVDAAPGSGPNDRASFSRNTIVVEVVGAPVSLALVDLPGIIHASEQSFSNSTEGPSSSTALSSSAPDYPALVMSLVREYASRPHSVLVAVVSCKEDLDTQSVLQLARELDPAGTRTLGVLTKADTIEEGCHGLYLDVMQGKRWPLRKGYYMLKNPSQAQLNSGMSAGAARAVEASFFAGGPWCSLGPAVAGRLGVHRLRGALARLLADLSSSSMPSLLADAQRQLMEVDAALALLPRPVLQAGGGKRSGRGGGPSSRQPPEVMLRHTMASLVEEVCGAVAGLLATHGGLMQFGGGGVAGGGGFGASASASFSGPGQPGLGGGGMVASRQFWTGLTSAFHEFRASVFAGRPAVVVNGTCFSCGTGDEELAPPPPFGGAPASPAPAHSLLLPAPAPDSLMVALTSPSRSPPPARGAGSTPPPQQQQQPSSLTLEEVWSLVEAHRGLELPGCAPYGAIQALVARSTCGWPAAVDALLQAATRRVSDSLMGVLQDRLGRFPAAHRAARGAAHTLVSEMAAVAADQVRTLVAMELQGPFTMNRAEFEQHAGSTLRQLREAVNAPPPLAAPAAAPTLLRRNMSMQHRDGAGSNSSGAGSVASASVLSFMAAPPPPPAPPPLPLPMPVMMPTATGATSDAVLTVVAVSLTYFTLAARRVVDYVPMFVVHNLVTRCGAELKTALAADLLAGRDPPALAALLAEDESLVTQRAHLQRQRDTLQAALRLMRSLGPDSGAM